MAEVKRVVSNLLQTLEVRQKEAVSLVDVIHQLQSYLDAESKSIVQGGLDRLLVRIRVEAAKRTAGLVVVLVSPEGWVTAGNTYNINSDSWLERLKSQGFRIMRLDEFSSFIQSLKSEVAEGNLMPIIEFLKANAKIEMPVVYRDAAPVSAVKQPRAPSTSSRWKPSDFLPAPFPHPPLPRGLFKD